MARRGLALLAGVVCANLPLTASRPVGRLAEPASSTGSGSIIMTASAASYLPFGATDYTAAKHGVLGFMRALLPNLAAEQQQQQQRRRIIRVNALAPGWTETNISSATPAVLAAVGAATQSADVVARCVALLVRRPPPSYAVLAEPATEKTATGR